MPLISARLTNRLMVVLSHGIRLTGKLWVRSGAPPIRDRLFRPWAELAQNLLLPIFAFPLTSKSYLNTIITRLLYFPCLRNLFVSAPCLRPLSFPQLSGGNTGDALRQSGRGYHLTLISCLLFLAFLSLQQSLLPSAPFSARPRWKGNIGGPKSISCNIYAPGKPQLLFLLSSFPFSSLLPALAL